MIVSKNSQIFVSQGLFWVKLAEIGWGIISPDINIDVSQFERIINGKDIDKEWDLDNSGKNFPG